MREISFCQDEKLLGLCHVLMILHQECISYAYN
jgi:hypothetical protein